MADTREPQRAPEIPDEAVYRAAKAMLQARMSGDPELGYTKLARAALEAGGPILAAHTLVEERRRAVELVRARLVPGGCEPTKDAADLLAAIKGDLDV